MSNTKDYPFIYRLTKAVSLVICLSVIMLCFASCGQPSMVNAATGEADGKKIYKFYCTSCHGPNGGRKIGKAPDLRVSSLTDSEIRQMIMYGSDKGMAAYQALIKGDELDALITHVKSLRN